MLIWIIGFSILGTLGAIAEATLFLLLSENTLSAATTLPGATFTHFWLAGTTVAAPYIPAISAASFLYTSTADLIPGLHRQVPPAASLSQLVLLLAGLRRIANYSSRRLIHASAYPG